MNDAEKPQADNDADEEDRAFPEGVHPDLAFLIGLANREKGKDDSMGFSMESPITVWVKGVQFTGHIASAKAGTLHFFKTWAEAVRTSSEFNGADEEQLEAVSSGLAGAATDIEAKVVAELEAHPRPKRFMSLTLKNAMVWRPGSLKATTAEFIRIRLDQIDAFTLGF